MAFTFFFRDLQTLELAVDLALPGLRGRAFIHVWDAGCAHGPEPYTLAILLRQRMSDFVFRNVRIHATDVERDFAEKVRQGTFGAHEVKRLPPAVVERFFQPVSADQVQVVAELREKVTFAHHDLLTLKPIREGLSLVICKNVLLHFTEDQRVEVLRMFHAALQPGGILVMEHTQRLPESLEQFFEAAAPHARVFRKLEHACPTQAPAFVGHPAESLKPGHLEKVARPSRWAKVVRKLTRRGSIDGDA